MEAGLSVTTHHSADGPAWSLRASSGERQQQRGRGRGRRPSRGCPAGERDPTARLGEAQGAHRSVWGSAGWWGGCTGEGPPQHRQKEAGGKEGQGPQGSQEGQQGFRQRTLLGQEPGVSRGDGGPQSPRAGGGRACPLKERETDLAVSPSTKAAWEWPPTAQPSPAGATSGCRDCVREKSLLIAL